MIKKIIVITFVGITLFPAFSQAASVDVGSLGVCTSNSDDDTSKIQTAINNLANGDTLNFSCMASINGSGLRVSGKSGIIISGNGNGSGLRATSGAGQGIPGFGPYMLVIENCPNCKVQNLEFDSSSLKVGALGVTGSIDVTVSSNYMHDVVGNVTGGAMASSLNTNLRVINNIVERTSRSAGSTDDPRGMWLGNGGLEETNLYMEGNTIRNVAGTGIAFHAKGFTLIRNNVDTTNGACVKHAYGGSETNQLIAENTFKNCKFNGIQIKDQGNHTVSNLVIRDNTIESNGNIEGGPGIAAFTRLQNSQIIRNKILNNNRVNFGGWLGGMYIQGADNLTISDNEFYDSGGSSGRQYMGMYIEPLQNSQNVTIKNNKFHNHSMSGIILSNRPGQTVSLSNVTIEKNVFSSNSQSAIKIEENTANMIGTISLLQNCFSGNGTNIQDNRGVRALVQVVSSASCSYPITIELGADTNPPTVPTSLSGTGTSDTRIDLSWQASSDNALVGQTASGVAGYKVYKSGVQIGTTPAPQYYDIPLQPQTTYLYSVAAYDNAGNTSAKTQNISVTTRSSGQKVGDLNNDGLVNSVDLSLLTSRWNQNYSSYDLNKDGIINSLDYVLMVKNWSP